MKATTSFFGLLALGLSACGPRVSVHFHEDENFNVTAYASDKQYSLDDLRVMVEDEAAFLCGQRLAHSLGEQTCELGDGQLCYSSMFCCEEPEIP